MPLDGPRFRDSAAIVLVRRRGGMLEVFWVRRSDKVSFMPGFHAFVGGVIGPADRSFKVADAEDERARMLRGCAVREAFEEIGVLPAREGRLDAATLAEARERLLSGEVQFPALVEEHGWRFHADDLAFAGRWITPAFAPVRFDTAYYLAYLPAGQTASIDDSELAEGEWITPDAAIERWKKGRATMAAPILAALTEIAQGEHELPRRLAASPEKLGKPPRIELNWGIVLHPMKTQPLPPADHTNAYLIGDGAMALVDPGGADDDDVEALRKLIARLAADGRRLERILLTHAHPDHIGGVEALRAALKVPVYGHAAIAGTVRLDGMLADGDTIALASPNADWTLRVIHTPGHARGHLCFFHERTGSLFTGDHVVGAGTVIVDPPEGDMADYIASLERLATLPARTIFPAHGSPQGAATRRIRALIVHRREREEKVLAALPSSGAEPRGLPALVAHAYSDTPAELHPLAERSLLAHLIKLEREGRAARQGDDWTLA